MIYINMDNDLINSKGDGQIVRSTSQDRLAVFNANANSIYNRFTPYTNYGNIGPSQPFVYTKISESTFSKNLTRYDSYAAPIGSTVRDAKRVGQYLVTGTGILFIGKQLLLQNKNAFNETRIYNPLSVLKATLKPGSLGAIDYPKRHLETSGGLLNFFKDALLSTIGFETKDAEKPRIDGTATGVGGVAYSNYVGNHGGGRAGMLRFGTAKAASSIFESTWVTNPNQGSTSGGFLANLGKALVNKLKSLIPSTNPLGAFGGSSGESWTYRPEYKSGKDGAYYAFLADNSGFLTVNAPSSQLFYNDGTFTNANAAGKSTVKLVSDYHKYYPQKQEDKSSRVWYADKTKISTDSVGVEDQQGYKNNLKTKHEMMVSAIASFKNEANQFRRSAERYSEIKDKNDEKYPAYKDIPNKGESDKKFETKISQKNATTLDRMGFAKVVPYSDLSKGTIGSDAYDKYNALELDDLKGKRGNIPYNITGYAENQSKDVIFFYFYDLINELYIPFRATISGITDQNSAEYEDISYLGRADKLYLYKGFTRDSNVNFTVYANSAKEMLPMWNRISYLVGLTRPSKYTGKATVTNTNQNVSTTGAESSFIYPPMVTLRLGDMYDDQPIIITSVSVTVPDDTNWESLRADEYEYLANPNSPLKMTGVKSRQLPMKVDVSVAMKLLEKKQPVASDLHYGRSEYDSSGKETKRWLL